jgi:hypothetical protein
MSTPTSSRRPSGGRGGLKSLITVGALTATALGWFLYGRPGPAEGASIAQAGATLPPGWADLQVPLPTLVPPSTVTALQSAPVVVQPVLRSVRLPAPAPITITRSSH